MGKEKKEGKKATAKSFDTQSPSGPIKQGFAIESFDGTGGNVKDGFSVEAGKKKK